MDSPALLTFVLDAISQKSDLSDTYENLCEEIKYVLSTDDLKTSNENIQKELDDALEAGQNLGLLTLSDDLVRLPSEVKKSESSQKSTDATEIYPRPRRSRSRRRH